MKFNTIAMRKCTIVYLLLFTLVLFAGCNSSNQNKNTDKVEESVDITSDAQTNQVQLGQEETIGFDINAIPISNADIGDFPFFTLPKGLKNQNKPLQRDFDACFFPVGGVMTLFEGKLYKINVEADDNEQFSQKYFEKSIEDYLESIGAVKVFDGTITKEEYDRYAEQDLNKGDEGDIGYTGERIKFYVLRTKDKGNVYVQFSANNVSGKLNVLQEES